MESKGHLVGKLALLAVSEVRNERQHAWFMISFVSIWHYSKLGKITGDTEVWSGDLVSMLSCFQITEETALDWRLVIPIVLTQKIRLGRTLASTWGSRDNHGCYHVYNHKQRTQI